MPEQRNRRSIDDVSDIGGYPQAKKGRRLPFKELFDQFDHKRFKILRIKRCSSSIGRKDLANNDCYSLNPFKMITFKR